MVPAYELMVEEAIWLSHSILTSVKHGMGCFQRAKLGL